MERMTIVDCISAWSWKGSKLAPDWSVKDYKTDFDSCEVKGQHVAAHENMLHVRIAHFGQRQGPQSSTVRSYWTDSMMVVNPILHVNMLLLAGQPHTHRHKLLRPCYVDGNKSIQSMHTAYVIK